MTTENQPGTAAEAHRCGFVALIGAPNAGKSTLINQLVGTKVSIVTHKVQTTRSKVTRFDTSSAMWRSFGRSTESTLLRTRIFR